MAPINLLKDTGRTRLPFLFVLGVFIVAPAIVIYFLGRPLSIPSVPLGTELAYSRIISVLSDLTNNKNPELLAMNDSWTPMLAALDALSGPRADQLYEYVFFEQSTRFQYPPTSLLSIELLKSIGLGLRSLNLLNLLVFLLCAALMGGLGWLLFIEKSIPACSANNSSTFKVFIVGMASASTFVFYPAVRALALGQIQLWIDAVFILSIICWLTNKRLMAGICIGLACSIKPQFILLVAWAFLWKEFKFAVGAISIIAILASISVARYGWHNHIAYLHVLSFLTKHGERFLANNSTNGILQSYLSHNSPYVWYHAPTPYNQLVYAGTVLASIASMVLIFAPSIFRPAKSKARIEHFVISGICVVIGSPVAWEHHYGILLPFYLITLKNLVSRQIELTTAGLGFGLWTSWVLVANFIPQTLLFSHSWLRFLQFTQFLGAVLLLAVLMFIYRWPAVPSNRLSPVRARP